MSDKPIEVHLAFKTALSKGGEIVRLEDGWPVGMPLPQIGDKIVVAGQGGFVRGIEYHPAKRMILIQIA